MTERFPAGWYPNQLGPGFRFWDGTSWTDHYLQSGAPDAPAAQSPQPGEVRQPPGAQGGGMPPQGSVELGAQPGQPLPGQQPQPGQPLPAQPDPSRQYQAQPGQAPYPAYPQQPAVAPAVPPQPQPRAQIGAALLAIAASAIALYAALTLPHSATDTLVNGGYYVKAPYYYWLLIGGGESILLGFGLLILTAARMRATWLTPLTFATGVLGALLLASAALILLSYEGARDDPAVGPEVPASQPPDSPNLLEGTSP